MIRYVLPDGRLKFFEHDLKWLTLAVAVDVMENVFETPSEAND